MRSAKDMPMLYVGFREGFSTEAFASIQDWRNVFEHITSNCVSFEVMVVIVLNINININSPEELLLGILNVIIGSW